MKNRIPIHRTFLLAGAATLLLLGSLAVQHINKLPVEERPPWEAIQRQGHSDGADVLAEGPETQREDMVRLLRFAQRELGDLLPDIKVIEHPSIHREAYYLGSVLVHVTYTPDRASNDELRARQQALEKATGKILRQDLMMMNGLYIQPHQRVAVSSHTHARTLAHELAHAVMNIDYRDWRNLPLRGLDEAIATGLGETALFERSKRSELCPDWLEKESADRMRRERETRTLGGDMNYHYTDEEIAIVSSYARLPLMEAFLDARKMFAEEKQRFYGHTTSRR